MLLLVSHQKAQHILRPLLVADHVVIDEEDAAHAEAPQLVEFAPDLIRALHARLASEHDDNVAKLAAERASTRVLDGGIGIKGQLQHVEARYWRIRQIDRSGFPVQRLGPARREVAAEFRPDVFRLAGDDGIGQAVIGFRAQRRRRPADDDIVAALPVIGEQFTLTWHLHAHAADADDVGRGGEGDRLDVLVDDFDLPVVRAQRRQGRQTKRRIDRAFARQDGVNRPFEAPETVRQLRID